MTTSLERQRCVCALAAALSGLGCSAEAGSENAPSGEAVSQTRQALNTSPAEGLYRISPQRAPHKSWDLPGVCPGQNNGASLALFHYDGHGCSESTGDQKWYIKYAGNDGQNYYEIRQGHANGKCLDIASAGGTNELITWDCNGNNWQRWYFEETESMNLYGHWQIKSRHNGKVIDLASGYTENGTDIIVWDDWNGAPQRWILSRADQAILKEDWSDDFTSLNAGNWNVADWDTSFVNNEKQKYKPWKASVNGRMLVLDAHHVGSGTAFGNYESARLNTKGKRRYANGAWSARLRYSDGGSLYWGATKASGTWPAFWVLGDNIDEHPTDDSHVAGACWPTFSARELDIWEYTANSGTNYFTAGHAGDICQNAHLTNGLGYAKSNNWFDPNAWYTFKVIFGQDGWIRFYRDGYEMYSFPSGYWTNQNMFIVLNLAVGGLLGGDNSAFDGADDWAKLEVDWVAHEYW